MEFGRQTTTERDSYGPARNQRDPTIPNWDFFDDVDLEELFAERVPMLKSWVKDGLWREEGVKAKKSR